MSVGLYYLSGPSHWRQEVYLYFASEPSQEWRGFCQKHLKAWILDTAVWSKGQCWEQTINRIRKLGGRGWKKEVHGRIRAFKSSPIYREIEKTTHMPRMGGKCFQGLRRPSTSGWPSDSVQVGSEHKCRVESGLAKQWMSSPAQTSLQRLRVFLLFFLLLASGI